MYVFVSYNVITNHCYREMDTKIMKGKGKTVKRKNEEVSPHVTANKQAAKKLRIAKEKENFHEAHGDSFNVYMFRKNMFELTQDDVAKVKTELTVYQVTNDITINITKSLFLAKQRVYLLRVHTQTERLQLHEMVENVLAGFTTYAKTDSNNMIKITLKIAHGFPKVLLKPDYLLKLLQTTFRKLVNHTIDGCKLLLPQRIILIHVKNQSGF